VRSRRTARERRTQRDFVDVVADGQEGHARVERVRRRDQQRVEGPEQVEASPFQQIAPVGEPHQQRVDRGRVVGPPQAVEPQQGREPRPLGAVRVQIAGGRGRVVVVGGRGAARALTIVGAGGQRAARRGGDATARASLRLPLRRPAAGGTAEGEILDLVEAHARDLDVDPAAQPAPRTEA